MNTDEQNLSESYSNDIVQEKLEVNRFAQMARDVGGRALKATGLFNTAGNKLQGRYEVGQETNRLFDMFTREVLANNPNPIGQNIVDWFQNRAKFSPENATLKNVNLKKAYSQSEIRGVFRDAVKQQALIFAGQTGVDSRYGDPETAQQLAASHIASLTFEQRKEFVKVLLQQGLMTPEELLSDEPLKNKPTTS